MGCPGGHQAAAGAAGGGQYAFIGEIGVMQHMGAEGAMGTMPWHIGCWGAYCERYIGTGGNIAGAGIAGGHEGPAASGAEGT